MGRKGNLVRYMDGILEELAGEGGERWGGKGAEKKKEGRTN